MTLAPIMDAERIAREVKDEYEALALLSQRKRPLRLRSVVLLLVFGICFGIVLFLDFRDFGNQAPQLLVYVMSSIGCFAGLAALVVSISINQRTDAAIELLLISRARRLQSSGLEEW